MPRITNPEHRQTFFKYKAFKEQSECFQCGETDYNKLEFHHLCYDDGDGNKITGKWLEVSRMVRENYEWNDVKDELDKCVPLCRDCHKDYHMTLGQ